MIIRKLTPQEQIDALKMQSLVFAYKRDFSHSESEPEIFRKGYEFTRALFDDSGKMCSLLYLIPFEVSFDGHTVKMGGIGNVSSLPEERNNGYIRSLLRSAFEEMLEDHQLFSYLHPFSVSYYKKFGYECCYKTTAVSIPFKSFRHFPKYGRVEMFKPSQSWKDIQDIYSRFISDKNLSIFRNEKRWNHLLDRDPYATRQYTYILYGEAGQPESYVIFRPDQVKDTNMQVMELVWTNHKALEGMLHFLQCFYPRFEMFQCTLPEFLNIHLLFPEPLDIKAESAVSGMNRIVNLQKVLEIMSYPEGIGQISIEVKDSFLEWNTGTYVITWGKEGTQVVKKDCRPDMSCSIEVLTQLITGYTGIDAYEGSGALEIHDHKSVLSSVFHKKKAYMNDMF